MIAGILLMTNDSFGLSTKASEIELKLINISFKC
jgi:hypothetical protein